MRDDMFKVIVERPRRGVGYYRTLPNDYRAAKRFKLDEDLEVNDEFCGIKVPMRARRLGWEHKELNENLKPLRRFLAKQIGRRWDDVYSEICSHLDTGSTVKQHVRQHLTDFVTIKTYIDEDGDLIALTRWGPREGAYSDLWVDPNGILCGYKPRESYRTRRRRNVAAQQKNHLEVNGIEYERNNKGLWFRIEKTEYEDTYPYFDRVSGTTRIRTTKNVHIRKWSLSKKELRDLGLRATA